MSTWCYLVTMNQAAGTRQQLIDFLDSIPEVTFWHTCLPSVVFCTSTLTAQELFEKIAARFGKDGGKRYLVLDTATDRQGWLPKQTWHMMTEPESPKLPE